jgi:1-acyl-sn-glycerol-3-phosphate acyltransferase
LKLGDIDGYDADYIRQNVWKWQKLFHRYFRTQLIGIENIPNSPFVGVGNHSGAVLIPDTLVWLSYYHSLEDSDSTKPPLLTLAHDAFFDVYPQKISRWASRFGAVRANKDIALKGLQNGYAVQIYPGGDFDACRPFAKRNTIEFAGRTGYVELAQRAGVPIVPIVSHGAHKSLIVLRSGKRLAKWLGVDRSLRLQTFPISVSIPLGLWIGPLPGYIPYPTQITITVCPPISSEGDILEIDKKVRRIMQKTLTRMAL